MSNFRIERGNFVNSGIIVLTKLKLYKEKNLETKEISVKVLDCSQI